MPPQQDVLRFWGKLPDDPGCLTEHPAVCHMLDVGLVALALMRGAAPGLLKILCAPLRCAPNDAKVWVALLAALHDLGKISPGFQAKSSAASRALSSEGYPFSSARDETDHGRVTARTLPPLLVSEFGCPADLAKTLGMAVAGHHGRFHAAQSIQRPVGNEPWPEARRVVTRVIREFLGVPAGPMPLRSSTGLCGDSRIGADYPLLLAGLTSLADWIGSDSTRFPFAGSDVGDLAAYVADRQARAEATLAELHLDDIPLLSGSSCFEALFPTFHPNACQSAAMELFRALRTPGLLLIETPTGSGKTEAALAIADALIRESGAAGLYYALPTQATGNQMFTRIRSFLENHPARRPGEVELHLLHSRSDFHPGYRELRSRGIGDGGKESVVASAWFTTRKRGLISPFAIGTLDQALMAALQVKHVFVRLFGLAGKVVIIDEVHAYDTYTSVLLDRLLAWLGRIGSPTILLSATLPSERRRDLLEAYAGRRLDCPDAPYPCVWAVGADQSVPVPSVDSLHRDPQLEAPRVVARPTHVAEPRQISLELMRIPRSERHEALVAKLKAELAEGGCAACIVNTVAEAQELFQAFRASDCLPGELHLFHARFPLDDRLQIERSIESGFGGRSTERPARAVVVATQVLEQSLDVDFDLMVTDLAPVDLILQRAGRLQRHRRSRPPRFARDPRLVVLMPDLHGPKPYFGYSEKVYEPSVLLRTGLVLGSMSSVRIPEDVRGMISGVYGPERVAIPAQLIDVLEAWDIEASAAARLVTYQGRDIALPRPDAYEPLDLLLQLARTAEDDDLPPPVTRLARTSLTVICLHRQRDGVSLDSAGSVPVDLGVRPTPELARRYLERSVTISNPHWVHAFLDEPIPEGWERSPHLRHCRAAIFEAGRISRGGQTVALDPELGIVIHRRKEA